MKLAVPTWTAAAPISKNSRASVALVIPPIPITGHLTARRDLVDAPKSDRLYGRSGKPPHYIGQPRPSGKNIHGHGRHGVYAGDNIASGPFGGPGDLRDARHVGRELGDYRKARGAPDGFHHPGGHRRIGPENHSAFFYIRAAYVYLQGGNPGRPIEPGGKFGIFLDRVAEDIYDHRNAQIAQKRELYGQKPFDPDIFQAYGVYHAGRGFDQAGRGVPGAGFKRNPLYHNGPETPQVEKTRIFLTVAESARMRS